MTKLKLTSLLLAGAMCLLPALGNAAPVVFDPGGFPSTKIAPLAERTQKPDGVEVQVWPGGIMNANHTAYLTSGSLTPLMMPVADPDSLDLKVGTLEFDLPVSVSLEYVNGYLNWSDMTKKSIQRDGKDYVHYSMNAYVGPTTVGRGLSGGGYFGRGRPYTIWVKTDSPSGTELGKMYMHMDYKVDVKSTFVTGKETWVNLQASDPVSSVQPKLVESGIMGRFNLNRSNIKAGSMETAVGDYVRSLGYNYIVTQLPIPAETGVHQWREMPIQNMLDYHDVPPDLQFVMDGKKLPNVLSPAALYHEDPWVKEHVFKDIDQFVNSKNVTGLWMNFEPYDYVEKGDQSERNRDEFIAWSKLPAADVVAMWPDGVAKKYPAQWRQFLSWQTEQCVKTYIKIIADAGKPYGTTPRFAFATTNDWIWGGAWKTPNGSISILNWGDLPITLQTWNFMDVPFYNSARYPLDRFMAPQAGRSGALATNLKQTLGAHSQLKIGCLYGWDQSGGGAGYFFPEQLAFMHTITALAGADNVQNYAAWPVWDGHYATAIAKANARIAHWEPFTVEGKRQREQVVIPVTDYPQKVPDNVTPAQQELQGDWAGAKDDPNYLYSFEYEKTNRRLIVVANTWTEGDVFYKLRVFHLDPHKKYVVWETEKHRLFVPSATSRSWTASQLEKTGPIVHTGACRISCFVIEQYQPKKNYDTAVTPEEVAEAIKNRKPPANPYE